MAYLIAMQFVVVDWVIPRNSVLDGGQIPHDKGQFSEGGGSIEQILHNLGKNVASTLQKRLNRSICRLKW